MPDYSLGDVARILKVSPRRLRYWRKTRLVETEEFGFRDLVVLRAITSLVDKGIPLRRIRRNLEILRDRLPEMDDPVASLRLLDDASDASPRLVVRHDGRLEETGGQLLFEFDSPPPTDSDAVASLAAFEAEAARRAEGDASEPVAGDELESSAADEALAWFERGCELDGDSARWNEAIEAYETALELEPDYADAYCNLGAVRYNQGQRAEARRAFEACLSREADHVEANFNLANVLEEEGDDRAALAHYRRALAADPFYPDLHINLALLYEKLERERPALEHWRRYLQLDATGAWAEVARLRLERESEKA